MSSRTGAARETKRKRQRPPLVRLQVPSPIAVSTRSSIQPNPVQSPEHVTYSHAFKPGLRQSDSQRRSEYPSIVGKMSLLFAPPERPPTTIVTPFGASSFPISRMPANSLRQTNLPGLRAPPVPGAEAEENAPPKSWSRRSRLESPDLFARRPSRKG